MGVAAVVTVRLRASRRNLRRLLGDLLDVEPPSVGMLQTLLEEVSGSLLPAYRQVRGALRSSAAVGADETGWKLRALRYWLWAGATASLSFYRLARSRNARERERLLGRDFAGVVTSDRYGAYKALPPERRQLCWAPLHRDFTAWQERGGAAERLGRWAVAETERMFSLWHRF